MNTQTLSPIISALSWSTDTPINQFLREKQKVVNAIISHDISPTDTTSEALAFEKRAIMQLQLMMAMIEIDMKNYPSIGSMSPAEMENIYENMANDWSRKYSSIFSHLWNTSICEYDDLFVALSSIQANNKLLH